MGLVPFEAHLEVWTLVAGTIAIGWYVAKVLQPKAKQLGLEPVTSAQKIWFGLALASMWVFSDWPIHEIAEQHLYFVHMFQHMFLSMLIPALFLLAMPVWLFDLVLKPGSRARALLQRASKPVFAGVVFNALTMLLHWSGVVQLSFESGPVHFALHMLIFFSGLLMWMPVIGPVKEWRIAPLAQCIYLFTMSIIPTVPGGWLVFAEGVVYQHYDTAERLWGIDVITDQQAAGVVMKLVGGFFLWAVILAIFVRYASSEMRKDEERRDAAARQLTYEHVTAEFERSKGPSESAL